MNRLAWRVSPAPVEDKPIVVEAPDPSAVESLADQSDYTLAFMASRGSKAALALLMQRASGGRS